MLASHDNWNNTAGVCKHPLGETSIPSSAEFGSMSKSAGILILPVQSPGLLTT